MYSPLCQRNKKINLTRLNCYLPIIKANIKFNNRVCLIQMASSQGFRGRPRLDRGATPSALDQPKRGVETVVDLPSI